MRRFMRPTSRRASAALGGALLGAGLALAGQPAAAQQQGTIYYMIPTLLDEFQTESQKAIEAVFGEMGYEVVSLDAQNRADLQLNQLEDVIELAPDAIIMNAVDFDAIVPGVEEARAAGIPVLNYDRQIRSTRVRADLGRGHGRDRPGGGRRGDPAFDRAPWRAHRHGAADPGRSRRQLHARHPAGLRGGDGGARRPTSRS